MRRGTIRRSVLAATVCLGIAAGATGVARAAPVAPFVSGHVNAYFLATDPRDPCIQENAYVDGLTSTNSVSPTVSLFVYSWNSCRNITLFWGSAQNVPVANGDLNIRRDVTRATLDTTIPVSEVTSGTDVPLDISLTWRNITPPTRSFSSGPVVVASASPARAFGSITDGSHEYAVGRTTRAFVLLAQSCSPSFRNRLCRRF